MRVAGRFRGWVRTSEDRPLFAAARIAHEAIWDLHHELVVTGSADERTRELLSEAARIASVSISSITDRSSSRTSGHGLTAAMEPV
jgi:hypothetical protein